jgi:succinate dehydrogenase / fumarate reductase cytochrome b subunit
VTTVADHTSTPQSAKDKYYFLIRRLHSLSGIVPVGVFVVFHLTINSTILVGPEKFQFAVDQIHLLDKIGLLFPIEMATIFLPILFHAVLGVVIVLGSTPNASVYRYGGNIRYTLQRVTGVIAFIFIAVHVWQMHKLGQPLGGGFFDPHDASASASGAIQTTWIWSAFYVVGVAATVFHFANGIWTALITWGITIGPRSQRIAGYFCTAFGIIVLAIGLGAAVGFSTFDPSKAPLNDAHTPAVVSQAPAAEIE